jgi:hypothetical protein
VQGHAADFISQSAVLHCKIALAQIGLPDVYDALQHELALLLSWTFPP